MNIITALNNETINEELKKQKEINIVSRDIPYREGILEILEKQQNVQAIIIYEGIYGQIKIEKLIQQIKNKNSKIIILIILNKKENLKEKYLIENKIKYLYLENLTAQKIIDYRNKNGNFNQIEDIKNVSGIGEAKFENIKDNIKVK